MSRSSPFVITLSDADRAGLERRARRYKLPHAEVLRAKIVLLAAEEGLVERVSRSTVHRWLEADAIRPWRYRSWTFPRDPDFEVKAGRVLDLYQRIWDGAGLGDDEYVISTDEKSQLQILSRRHPGLPPAPGGRPAGWSSSTSVHGTVACMAAYDVHRARLMGRVEPTTGIAPFTALVNQVMTAEPYGPARAGCSGPPVTDRPTAARLLSTGWPRPGRTPFWCTRRCTPCGRTRSRSSSPSSSAR